MRHDRGLFARLAFGMLLCILPAAAQDSAQPAKTHTILIKGFQFVPERLEVAAGDTVVWKNEDIVPHTATARKAFDSKSIEKGQSWTFVAKPKGSHAYICAFHPTMKGELVVK